MNAPEEHMGGKGARRYDIDLSSGLFGPILFDDIDHLLGGDDHHVAGSYLFVNLLVGFLNFIFSHCARSLLSGSRVFNLGADIVLDPCGIPPFDGIYVRLVDQHTVMEVVSTCHTGHTPCFR